MKYKDIVLSIKKKDFLPIYFLSGDEKYYIDELIDFFIKSVLEEEEKIFNQVILYGKDTDIDQIISESKQFPIAAKNRLVVVKEGQNLKNIDKLENYINNPQTSTILVISYFNKTIDKRKKFGKNLYKKGFIFESKKLYDNQIPDWIEAYLNKKKITIDTKATILLSEFLGNNLSKIKNEIEKLLIIAKENHITPQLIEKHIGINNDYNLFELQNAFGEKNYKKISLIINHFISNEKKYNIVSIISNLFYFFQKIFLLKSLKGNENASNILKIHPFFLKQYQKAAFNYSNKQLFHIFELLKNYDLKSKGVKNKVKNKELIKELMLKIILQ
ncbi:MAG: DNA polymerase III subunit delta [Flavobacteriales bacterium]|nr:MAG: DNA polymerase III subunit delta [Flavobacteriales bacterium]